MSGGSCAALPVPANRKIDGMPDRERESGVAYDRQSTMYYFYCIAFAIGEVLDGYRRFIHSSEKRREDESAHGVCKCARVRSNSIAIFDLFFATFFLLIAFGLWNCRSHLCLLNMSVCLCEPVFLSIVIVVDVLFRVYQLRMSR